MATITFEGPEPFGLGPAKTATAHAAGDAVVMILHVSLPAISPNPVQIQIPMTASVAHLLGAELQAAVVQAELNVSR